MPSTALQDFTGRVALVTGAARGLGRAVAARLHERGASVAVNVRDTERAATAAREIGERALAVPGDLAAAGVPDDIVGRTLDRFGRIDILVNNAALPLTTRFEQVTAEEWRQALEVNLTAPFLLIKAVLPAMKAKRYGRIVNIASVIGLIGNAGQCNYGASKAGVIGLTKSAARELASRGITVNAVAPGFIETAMTAKISPEAREALLKQIPLASLGQPEDVASAVLFFASPAACYITGQVLAVDGGMAM